MSPVEFIAEAFVAQQRGQQLPEKVTAFLKKLSQAQKKGGLDAVQRFQRKQMD